MHATVPWLVDDATSASYDVTVVLFQFFAYVDLSMCVYIVDKFNIQTPFKKLITEVKKRKRSEN